MDSASKKQAAWTAGAPTRFGSAEESGLKPLAARDTSYASAVPAVQGRLQELGAARPAAEGLAAGLTVVPAEEMREELRANPLIASIEAQGKEQTSKLYVDAHGSPMRPKHPPGARPQAAPAAAPGPKEEADAELAQGPSPDKDRTFLKTKGAWKLAAAQSKVMADVNQAENPHMELGERSRALAGEGKAFDLAELQLLFSYARHGKYGQLRELFKKGVPVDSRDRFGNTALIIACQNSHGKIVKMAVRYECDLDAQNKRGNSALHFSVAYGFQAISDFLIEHGARTDLANESGLTCYEGI